MEAVETQEERFLVDLTYNEEKIILKYSDDTVKTEDFTYHNLHFQRTRLINSVQKYLPQEIQELGEDSLKAFAKQYGSIILDIIGLVFLYNLDISLVIKIIITIVAVLGELAFLTFNRLMLILINDDALKLLALQEYVNNVHEFEYYNEDIGEYSYLLPIETVIQKNITANDIKGIIEIIKDFEKKGSQKKNIKISLGFLDDLEHQNSIAQELVAEQEAVEETQKRLLYKNEESN